MIDDIKQFVLAVSDKLKETRQSVATAESCTGGGLSYWLTSVPGSSAWFDRAYVTYSNQAKIDMLGVRAATIASYGAVSAETAREMVEGLLQKSSATIGIAITGIAGPTGDSSDKPVGTVWIAWAKRGDDSKTEMHVFQGDRQEVRLRAIAKALEKILITSTNE